MTFHFPIKLLKLPEVKSITGLSKSSIYARIAEGTFPKQIPLGGSRYSTLDKGASACCEGLITPLFFMPIHQLA